MTSGAGSVRVLAVADEVDDLLDAAAIRSLAPQVVVSAGDLPFEYLEYLVTISNVPLVYVPGNHDPDVGQDGRPSVSLGKTLPIAYEDLRGAPKGPGGGMNADGRIVEAGPLRVAGLGGCVRYREGPNQYTQGQLRRRAARLRRRARLGRRPVDLLLTHAPPRGVGDVQGDPAHVGIEALHGLVDALRPTVLVHGHVIPMGSRRADRMMGATLVVNAAPHRILRVPLRVRDRGAAA